MDKDWLKNNLRNRFDGQEAPMDMEAEWAALQNRRQPKKSKRFLFWWFGGLGSLLLIAFFGWQINTANSPSNQKNITSVKQGKTERKTPIEVEQITTLSIDETTSTESELLTSNEQSIASDNQTEYAKPSEASIKIDSEFALGRKQQIGNKNTPFRNIKASTSSTFAANIRESKTLIDIEKTVNTLLTKEQETKELTIIETQKNNPVKRNLLLENDINYLKNTTQTNLLEYTFQAPSLNPWKKVSNIEDLPQYNINKYNQGVGIHIGYGWNNRTLEAVNANSREIVERRNGAELTLDIIDLSLSYRRLLNQKVYVEGHLGVQQAMDRLNEEYSNTESMLIENQPIVIRNLPDGTTETEMGTIEATVFNSVKGTFYQTYRQGYASVLIGFYDQTEADWIVSFAAGLDLAIWSSINGNVFQDADSLGQYARLEDSSYKKSGVLSALMRLEGSRLIGATNELGLGIQAQINISDNYKDTDIAERRQWITGRIFYRKWF